MSNVQQVMDRLDELEQRVAALEKQAKHKAAKNGDDKTNDAPPAS